MCKILAINCLYQKDGQGLLLLSAFPVAWDDIKLPPTILTEFLGVVSEPVIAPCHDIRPPPLAT